MKTKNDRNDILIVFNALKYGMILITNDGESKRQPGGILGCRDELARLSLSVMTDDKAVALVLERIEVRDKGAIWWAEITGKPIPGWFGKD